MSKAISQSTSKVLNQSTSKVMTRSNVVIVEDTQPAEPKPPQEAEGETKSLEKTGGDAGATKRKKGKKKAKKIDIMGDKAFKFKNVSFDQALTEEEKAVKKKAKLAAKKGGKKKKKKKDEETATVEVKAEAPSEALPEALPEEAPEEKKSGEQFEGIIIAEAILAERASDQGSKKAGKKGKKGTKEKGEKKRKRKKGKSVEELTELPSVPTFDEQVTPLKAPEGQEKGEEVKKEEKKGKIKKGKGKKEKLEGEEKKAEKGKTEEKVEKEIKEEGEEKDEGEVAGKGKKKKRRRSKLRSLVQLDEGEAATSSVVLESKKASKKWAKSLSEEGTLQSIPKAISSIGRSRLTLGSSLYSYFGDGSLSLGESDGESEEGTPKDSLLEKKEKKGKGKAKGKKGKKGKVERLEETEKEETVTIKEPVVDAPKVETKAKRSKKEKHVEEEDDVLAQILKMKREADKAAGAAPTEPSVAESKKSKKGPPPKKLSRKEKAKLEAQRLEEARIQAELELQAQLEEERKRQAYVKKYAKDKDKKDASEQVLRLDQLNASTAWIKCMMDFNWDLNSKEKAANEWAQYLKCDGLPDPANPAQMNTYLHLWEKASNNVTPEECVRRTNEVLGLLRSLNDFIDDPFDVTDRIQEDWQWVRGLCRDAQWENLNMTTYRLLRDIDNRLNRVSIPTADYRIVDPNFTLCMFVMVQLATPMYNPRTAQKPRLNINFPEIEMEVLFPGAVEGRRVAVRGIYVKYDHLTDTCATFKRPPIPDDCKIDLLEATNKDWYVKMMYKFKNRKKKLLMIEDEQGNLVEGPEEPDPEFKEGELPPAVPFMLLDPTPSDHAVNLEDEMYAKNRAKFCDQMPNEENVINLRKHLIIGGVFYLNLFYQPPQPHDKVAFDISMTRLLMPKRLSEIPFSAEYKPAAPEDPENKKTPEELEEDMKDQEQELDKLLLFSVKLPEHVIFLDLPTLCAWDSNRKAWTTAEVYDVRHIEDKNLVMFRTSTFTAFSFAVNRYINLPFQTWELKPEADGTATFQLTCAILMVEFNAKRNMVCMTQLQNSPNNALQDIIGIYYKLPKLIRILREGGVDLFPAFDAFCYIESGVCEKHWPLEKHLYYLMGLLSSSFNFTWSRWNVQSSRRNIVMQMREYHHGRPKQQNFHMLLVTPLKAVFIDTTEISSSFSDEPMQGMKFCSDLFHLVKATSTMSMKNKVTKGPLDVAKTIGDLLIATRVHSFS